MNYMVMVFLCDQFAQLNEEFNKCIGDRGQFGGDFEQFWRRHRVISRTVQEADRFLMVTSGANFCCQIISIILVLYSVVVLEESPCPRGCSRTNFQVLVLVLVLGSQVLDNNTGSLQHNFLPGGNYFI